MNASNEVTQNLDHLQIKDINEAGISDVKNSMNYNVSELNLPEDSKIHLNISKNTFKKKPKNNLTQIFEFEENLEYDIIERNSNLNETIDLSNDFNYEFLNTDFDESSKTKGYKLTYIKGPVKYEIKIFREISPKSHEKFTQNIFDPHYAKKGKTVAYFKVNRRFNDFFLLLKNLEQLSDLIHFPTIGSKKKFTDLFKFDKEEFYIKRKIYLQIFLHQIIAYDSILSNYNFYTDFFDHVSIIDQSVLTNFRNWSQNSIKKFIKSEIISIYSEYSRRKTTQLN
jgi:hypothetical protein